MKTTSAPLWTALCLLLGLAVLPAYGQADGDGAVSITGEQKQWHKVTLTVAGPFARETDTDPNPFTDIAMRVTFTHESGKPSYTVPGYFAADGNAGESSATAGNQWRAHFSPDKPGEWRYTVELLRSPGLALQTPAERSGTSKRHTELVGHGKSGTLSIKKTDKRGRDLRADGRLTYVGKRYLQFAGSKQYFLKAGADAPETLLAYKDFDNTIGRKKNAPLKAYKPHVRDWEKGDPTWQRGKGKGLIGAINYLSSTGCNAFSFLTYNAGGDGDNVWPFIARDKKLHYDCSKLDQWQVIFDHAQAKGMYLHFKLQETENDDNKKGKKTGVPESLDGGDLGKQRKLYLREIIARFGYLLALNWNLGEENTQSTQQQKAMASYIHAMDPYHHHIVLHTYPSQQDKMYGALLGKQSKLTGVSLQNSNVRDCHWQTLKWVQRSAESGRPWVVAFDEPGEASFGTPPDPDYPGMGAFKKLPATIHDVRSCALWGTLLAGGTGVEYYFGYKLPQNDLNCEDWRSRAQTWRYSSIALSFFSDNKIPFWEMDSQNALIGADPKKNEGYCFAKRGEVYLVYLPDGKSRTLDLSGQRGEFTVKWFNPRAGGKLVSGSVASVKGGKKAVIGNPPKGKGDWLAVVQRR